MRAVQTALRIGLRDTLVDLGCGHGGPGLWVIQQSGANLIGIDLSPVGVTLAQERAASQGLGGRANFRVGDIAATGLPDSSSDAALSLDVLVFVPDKAAAMREVARILRPGGRFAFTTWEQSGYSARLGTMQLADYRPVLKAAGFTVEAYEQPMNSQRQQRAVVEGIIASEPELTKEVGTASAAGLLAMARGMLSDMHERRYVFGAARKGK